MLDDPKTYKRYDKDDIAYGVERLSEQARIAWRETRSIKLPKAYRGVEQIFVVGMGGSALGAHVIQHALTDRMKVPMIISRDYTLPGFVGRKTLVLLSSFSGSTEEVLYAGREAKKRGAKMAVITAGGKLAAFGKRHKLPMYRFEPGDIAKEPRLGVGFTMVGTMGILERAGLLRVKAGEIKSMIQAMNDVVDTCAIDVPSAKNPAKTVAMQMKDHEVVIVGSDHLVGNAHIMRNQILETAKQLAMYRKIPDLNHYLMEGLTYPKGFFKSYRVLMLHSSLYYPRNQKRYGITSDIFEQQGAQIIEYYAGGKTQLEECGELLQFGSFLSYYMAMQNGVNPKLIPFVDLFKERLAKG